MKEGQGASIYNIRNTLVPYRCTGHVTTSVYPFTRSTEEVGSQLSLTYSLKTIPFLLQVKMKLPIIAALASSAAAFAPNAQPAAQTALNAESDRRSFIGAVAAAIGAAAIPGC